MNRLQFTATRLARLAAAAAFLLAGALGPTTRGDLVIELPDVEAVSDGINPVFGVFEVTLTLTEADIASPPAIGSYNLDFSVAGIDVFLAAPTSPTTVATPLFDGGSFSSLTAGQAVKAAADLFTSTPTSVPAFNVAGLVSVAFAAAPGQFGTYSLDFGTLNQFTDAGATPIPITLRGGSISIVLAVPEAGAWRLWAIPATAVAASAATRRLRAKAGRAANDD